MFPRISDVINYLFGTQINVPVQSYGFFVAIAFLMGAYLIKIELKRKEKEGLLHTMTKRILKGAPVKPSELIANGIFGLLAGYKLFGIMFDYDLFSDNPQTYLLSAKGSLVGGVVLAAIMVYWKYYSKKKEKLDKPVYEEIEVHPYQLTGNIVIITAITGIIGAKLFHNFENFHALINDLIGSIFSFSGLTFYGGLISGTFFAIWYAKRNRIPARDLIDASSPALMLSYGIGRMGCMVSGDGCWGIANLNPKPEWLSWLPDWMWAFRFPHNVIGEGIPIDPCSGKYCNILEHPVYPTSFYDFVLCVLFFIVLWYVRKKINVHGALFSIMIIIMGMQRYFMEMIRVNNKMDIFGMEFTQAELISIAIIIFGCVSLGLFYRMDKKNPQNTIP